MQVAIITGGSSGIGFNATKKMVEKGVFCIIASRNMKNIDAAVAKIKTETGRENVEGMMLDLCDYASVRKFANDFLQKNLPLHILVNNAGIINTTKVLAEGNEATFVANHLGHFLLTNLLLDKLKASAPSRIVIVGSSMHDYSRGHGSRKELTLDTFNFDTIPFDSTAAYRFSKLANVQFGYELNRRLEGTGVIVNTLCPGFIPATSLGRDHAMILQVLLKYVLVHFMNAKTLDYGGDCIVDLALGEDIKDGGHFFRDREIAKSSARSCDQEEQRRLWEVSQKLVGLAP